MSAQARPPVETSYVSGEQKGEQAKGKLKETAGRVTGNEWLTAEGRAEQAKGDAREAKEKVKDVFKR
ncbi:CsbD family protein [Streptomyces sp. NPDC056544]|uniref:CsbD family protein n=1 Tax=unclassified Streptomyces TaxID=2593676 RepID=UPI0036B42E9B